jgi:dienelactone hydrolase
MIGSPGRRYRVAALLALLLLAGLRPGPSLLHMLAHSGSRFAPGAADAAAAPAVTLHRASTHPMRYHLALPAGWVAGRSWPVVVVVPAADREFAANLDRFVAARGDRAFILVAPEVLTCGGAGSRTLEHYTYTPSEWDSLANGDDYAFDEAGLAAVLADVHRGWGGEPKAFLTGWEAGGHTVWAQAFRHPERWSAVAPVTPNYQRRGLGDKDFSTAPERSKLPIHVFRCGAPSGDAAALVTHIDQQTRQAAADARAHGFAAVTVEVVPGVDHGPLPGVVLAWFDSLARPRPSHP